jgi:prepilin-type N-terminal cleavage/methylation domain-containing protein
MKTTLAIGNDGRSRRAGFTLIEISIAVFIIAIVLALAMPNFIRSYHEQLLNETGRTLVTDCEFAKLNAVLHQQKVACYIDMDKQTVWLMQFTSPPDADSALQPPSEILKTIEISPHISLVSAQAGDQLAQQKGQVEVTFYPNGTCDPFTVTLGGAEGRNGLQMIVDPVTCRGMLWPVKL